MDCSQEITEKSDIDAKIRNKIFCPRYDQDVPPPTEKVQVNFGYKLVSFDFVSSHALIKKPFIETYV